MVAIGLNDIKKVSYIISSGGHVYLNMGSSSGKTPRMLAEAKGYDEIVALLSPDEEKISQDLIKLVEAIKNNEIETARSLVQKNVAVVNGMDKNNWTPLLSTAYLGRKNILQLLIESGAGKSIDIRNRDGWTPLLSAIHKKHYDIAKILIESGTNPNITNSYKFSALMMVVQNDNQEMVELLLEKGADVLLENSDGKRAQDLAKSPTIRELLINKSPHRNKDNMGEDLCRSAYRGEEEKARTLLNQDVNLDIINWRNYHGWTPLMNAASSGHCKVVELLLEKDADPDLANNDGWTPLMSAARAEHEEVVKLLIKKGADISIKNPRGENAFKIAKEGIKSIILDADDKQQSRQQESAINENLSCFVRACVDGNLEDAEKLFHDKIIGLSEDEIHEAFTKAIIHHHLNIAEFLIDNEVNLNQPTATLLLKKAVGLGNKKVVEFLIKKDADPNNNHRPNLTALSLAVSKNYVDIAKMLLWNGADPYMQNGNFRDTALDMVRRNGKPEMKKVFDDYASLSELDEEGNLPIIAASKYGEIERAQELIAMGANVNDVGGERGIAPLILASENGYLEMVKLLLDNKADVNAEGENGWTVLMWASHEGHCDVVELFLSNGANVDGISIDDNSKERETTPLILASGNGHLEIVELLLDKGAELALYNVHYQTALDIALQDENIKMFQMLVGRYPNPQEQVFSLIDFAMFVNDQMAVKFIIRDINVVDCNQKDFTNKKFLVRAIENRQSEIAEIFLENNAIYPDRLELQRLFMHACRSQVSRRIISILLGMGASADKVYTHEIDVDEGQGRTPLTMASYVGCLEGVKTLCELSPKSTDIRDEYGQTALMLACECGHKEIVESLIALNSDVNCVDNDNQTALHKACKCGCPKLEVVSVLLNTENIKINHFDKSRKTALMIAIGGGHEDIVNSLLEKGAEIDLQDNVGQTALMIASINGHENIVINLIRWRPGENIRDCRGRTALDLARIHQHHNIVRLLADDEHHHFDQLRR